MIKRWNRRHGLCVCLLLGVAILPCVAGLTEVTVEGKASGDVANAREQALTDALREAVRVGAGVDVLSQTEVRDFVLEYDRIFAAAFGYVKGYTVLSSGLSGDGLYRVKIRAQVGAGQPGMKDVLALQMINKLKVSPRVSIEVDELIEGVPAGSNYAKTWFEQAAREMQLQLVDISRMTRQSDRLATRDAFFGDQRGAEYRQAGISQMTDFIIQVRVRGRYLGRELLYGLPTQRFSFAVDLRAVLPDSGEVVASVPMEGKEINSELESAEVAARDILQKMLSGDRRGEFPGAWVLFRRIFAKWVTELDLGTISRLELKGMPDAEFMRLQKALAETEKISNVFPREFDPRGMSFMDVETRLDPTGLKDVVLQALGGGWQCVSYTKHYLQFAKGAGGQRTTVSSQSTSDSHPPHLSPHPSAKGGIPPWAWALIGAGGVALLFGIYNLGKHGGKR